MAVLLCLGGLAPKASAAVTFQNNAALAFGSLVAVPSVGTVTISSAGSRSVNAVIPFGGGGFSPASFTVTIPAGDPRFSIVLPSSATLADGMGNTMAVDRFESTPASGKVDRSGTDSATISVGATLHVGGNQPPGSYSGTFLVMVTNP
jgi:hypothetical protein